MDSSYNILIAGCGYVGTELGQRLAQEGHRVWGLRRHAAALPAPIMPLQADLCDPDSLGELPAGLEYVCYTAAAAGFREEYYRDAYVTGLDQLLRALMRQGQSPRRVLFTSSTAVYGQRTGEWVDEDSPTTPANFSGAVLLQGEEILQASPYPATAVRLAGIYGPGRTRLIRTVRDGTATCSNGPPVYTNRIHRDDCAGVLRHLMFLEEAPAVVIGVDNEPADQNTVIRWLAEQLGVPHPPLREPAAQDAPQRGNKRCSNRRLLGTGYRMLFPTFREGYASLLDEEVSS